MSAKNDKELNLNFDEYIRQGEPQKKERAEAWRVAIYPSGGTSKEREGRGLARSHRFAGGGRTEGIRLLAGTCPKKYRG